MYLLHVMFIDIFFCLQFDAYFLNAILVFFITGIDGQGDMRLICGITAAEEKGKPERVDKVCKKKNHFSLISLFWIYLISKNKKQSLKTQMDDLHSELTCFFLFLVYFPLWWYWAWFWYGTLRIVAVYLGKPEDIFAILSLFFQAREQILQCFESGN